MKEDANEETKEEMKEGMKEEMKERLELACITASGVFGCTAFIILTINFAVVNNG